jgi:hypothetical protein
MNQPARDIRTQNHSSIYAMQTGQGTLWSQIVDNVLVLMLE